MNKKEIAPTIQKYMEDESQLLQDWYRDYYTVEMFPGERLAAIPSLDDIRNAFAEWYEHNKAQLFNLVCVEWDYPRKRKEERFLQQIELAAAIAEFLISCTWKVPAPVATAVLLVRVGLDELCGVHEVA